MSGKARIRREPAQPVASFLAMSMLREPIELDPAAVDLLDTALRMAYTRLIDASVLNNQTIRHARDALVRTMVKSILNGGRDPWRVARRGIFAMCEQVGTVGSSERGSA